MYIYNCISTIYIISVRKYPNLLIMTDICNLCLGDETEIPPFGSLSDARELIHPCNTCSFVAHKKCLLDWFNSLPPEKLQVIDSKSLKTVLIDELSSNNTRNSLIDISNMASDEGMRSEIHINLSPRNISDWLDRLLPTSSKLSSSAYLFLVAPCPQCKKDIVFSMKRSPLLAINSGIRSILSTGLQYSGIVLTVTSAVTGIVSMGYIGLTSCGLKIIGNLVPQQLLIKLLTKNKSILTPVNYTSLFKENYLENLENALSTGVIDPFKFSRIPILPIMMYRMRQSSIIGNIFGKELSNWFLELVISLYFSSLGNNQLASSIYENLISSVTSMIQNPLKFYRYLNLLKGVDFNDVNNLIGLVVPMRWVYDLFYRLTINQLNFDLVMSIRPRSIANNFKDYEELELYNADLYDMTKQMINEDQPLKNKGNLLFKILKTKLWILNLKLRACLRFDYSTTLNRDSFTIKTLTTLVWPFMSSKVGEYLFRLLKFKGGDSDRLFCNLIGLALVVVAKDLGNLCLNYIKVRQLSKLEVINVEKLEHDLRPVDTDATETNSFSMPGGFQ